MALGDGAVSEGFKNTAQGSGVGIGKDLTKGLWTPKEDALLAKYVMENGERNWNDLSRKFGLMRCGNSCRLRWFNHLRSNLKKGDFTPEEENKIIKLHAKYGNRWSRIARNLPGRTDNQIKNFWNTRLKILVHAGLPIYPPEILQEIRHRHFNHQQLQQPQQNHIKLSSPLSLSSPQNPVFSSFPNSSSSSFEENPNFNCIPSITDAALSSLSSIQENPDFSSINSMPLIDLMSYPLLVASLYPPINMYQFNLHSDNNGGVVLSTPPSQNQNFSNSPYTPLFHQSQLAPSGMNIVHMDDAFMSENCTIETYKIPSCFQAISQTSSSTNVNDHFIVPSNGEDNYNMGPELCSERNSGLLEDVLKQSAALLSSQLPYEEDKQSGKDQSDERIMHDDYVAIMNLPNSNVNLESVFGSSADKMNHMDDSSSRFSSNGSWLDFPPTGHSQALNLRSDNAPTEQANVSNDTMAATAIKLQEEVACCVVATTPSETDHDWA